MVKVLFPYCRWSLVAGEIAYHAMMEWPGESGTCYELTSCLLMTGLLWKLGAKAAT